MDVSFAERLALLMTLSRAQGGTLPQEAHQLAQTVSLDVGHRVDAATAEMWIDGRALPSLDERRAIASCFGFDGADAAFLVSDVPAAYMAYYETVSTYVELATNGSGLVALRPLTDAPLSEEAIKDLGRLV